MRCSSFHHNVDDCLRAGILFVWQSYAITAILSLPRYDASSCGCRFVLSSVIPSSLLSRLLLVNVIASAWLVAWPIYILGQMKLPRVHHRLLIACFSTGCPLAILNVVHSVNIFKNDSAHAVITGHLEVIFDDI